MLAQKMEEMLERRRAIFAEWSREFGFEAPPPSGGWEELDAYEKENADVLERADLMSELNQVLGDHA